MESPPSAQNAFYSLNTCTHAELGHWCLHAGAHGSTCVCPDKPSVRLGLPAPLSVLTYQQCLAVTRLKTRVTVWKAFGLPVRATQVTHENSAARDRALRPSGRSECTAAVGERKQGLTSGDGRSSSLGCEVHSDRRVPGSGSGAAELPGPGRPAERGRVHVSSRPVEPRNHFTGDVLRNEAEAHGQVSGVEGACTLVTGPALCPPTSGSCPWRQLCVPRLLLQPAACRVVTTRSVAVNASDLARSVV